MTEEHRLTFDLRPATQLESLALAAVQEKAAISKRCHEYIRRLMVQGLILKKVLKRVDAAIAEVAEAVAAPSNTVAAQELKFRLNVEAPVIGGEKTFEEEIWQTVSGISRREHRKGYLRDLFLHGYWFEILPQRELAVVRQLIAPAQMENANVAELTVPPVKNSAKSKLGGLMPL